MVRKKTIMIFISLLFIALINSMVFAADNDDAAAKSRNWFLKPTIEVGYALQGDTDLTFTQKNGTPLGGVTKIEHELPDVPGTYIAVGLPVALTDRLNLALEGQWIIPGEQKEVGESFNNGLANRDWNTGNRDWTTVDLTLSYAFLKDIFIIKDVSASVGFQWDYYKMDFRSAHDPVNVLSSPHDTIDFKMNTYAPILGLSATFKGPKSGILGGDIKIGVSGSPYAWGDVEYNESFAGFANIDFDGDLDRCHFYHFSAEWTLLSGEITPDIGMSLSLKGQYTKFSVKSKLKGEIDLGTGKGDFDFRMQPDAATVGLALALTF